MATLRLSVASSKLRSTQASPARILNMYAEPLPAGAKTPLILSRVPGVAPFALPGNGPIRGLHRAFGSLYAVSGAHLWKIAQNGALTDLGAVGSGAVSMANNAEHLIVVTAPDAYYSDGTSASGVAQITDTDYTSRGAIKVRFMDNFMIFLEPDSDRFFCADLGSVTDFDSLDFASAEGAPDRLIGMEVDHRQVILFGADSVEIWENVGGSGFPFQRSINGFIEIGCYNGDTIAKVDNSVIWLASDYSVRKLDGATPVRISTYALEQFLAGVDVTTGSAYSYSQDGHIFYVLSFSTGCWVWDATTNEWHERASHPQDYYRWQFHASAYGLQFVGDAFSNKVGKLDPTVYDEHGSVQRASWTYQPVYSENRMAMHHRLEVVFEAGVGLTSGQGSDPEIMMDYSDDGGLTWTTLPNRRLGKIGEYLWRAEWHGLGSARQRVYRGAVSDPVRVVLSDTVLDVTGGRL